MVEQPGTAADGPSKNWQLGLERELLLVSRNTTIVTTIEEGWQLDRSAYLLLARLEIDGPLSIKGLAERLGLDTSTVNRQTSSLLSSGLIERILDPNGGVARQLSPTELGLRLLREDRASRLVAISRLVDDWDLADVERLVLVLRRLNERLEERIGISWPREALQ